MQTFFGSIFIKRETLKEAGIIYPIKLEYYKIINEDQLVKGKGPKYGIKVIKTEYLKTKTKTEDETIKYLSNNEEKVNEVLEVLKENEVTPICVQDVICDFSKKAFLL